MNKHITEPGGEVHSPLPELGFAFGKVPIQKIADFLASPEMRANREAQDLKLGIDVISNYFRNGPMLMLWESYREAQKQADKATYDEWLSDEIADRYLQIAQIILDDHYRYIDEEKEGINSFLNAHEGFIVNENRAPLIGVDTIHKKLTPREVRAEVAPIEQVAFWADATEEPVVTSETQLYVNVAALPDSYAKNLDHYRNLYGVTLSS
jgi:hypothetical protein